MLLSELEPANTWRGLCLTVLQWNSKGGWEAVWLSGLESSSCVTDKKASEGSPAMCDKGGYTSSDKEGLAAPLPDLTHTPAQGPPHSVELHTRMHARTHTDTAYVLSETTRKWL